ncbi:MAG: hypothetical protein WA945_10260 [Arcobacteraceae bacterium]
MISKERREEIPNIKRQIDVYIKKVENFKSHQSKIMEKYISSLKNVKNVFSNNLENYAFDELSEGLLKVFIKIDKYVGVQQNKQGALK